MKQCKKLSVYLLLSLFLLSLSACGSERPETTTVCVDKNGKLRQVLVDTQAEYAAAALQEYTEERIAAYLKTAGDAEVRLESCEEKDGVVYMELSYGSSGDYTGFNSMECYLGTLEEASEAGVLPTEPLTDREGNAVDAAALREEHPEYHLLMLAENTRVQIDTAILGASALATVTDEKTAVIGDGDAGTSGYYPRKTEGSAWLIFE